MVGCCGIVLAGGGRDAGSNQGRVLEARDESRLGSVVALAGSGVGPKGERAVAKKVKGMGRAVAGAGAVGIKACAGALFVGRGASAGVGMEGRAVAEAEAVSFWAETGVNPLPSWGAKKVIQGGSVVVGPVKEPTRDRHLKILASRSVTC